MRLKIVTVPILFLLVIPALAQMGDPSVGSTKIPNQELDPTRGIRARVRSRPCMRHCLNSTSGRKKTPCLKMPSLKADGLAAPERTSTPTISGGHSTEIRPRSRYLVCRRTRSANIFVTDSKSAATSSISTSPWASSYLPPK